MTLAAGELHTLILNEPQLSVIKVPLFLDRLDIVKEELVVSELLRQVLLQGREDSINLLHSLIGHDVGVRRTAERMAANERALAHGLRNLLAANVGALTHGLRNLLSHVDS